MADITPPKGATIEQSGYKLVFDGEKWSGTNDDGHPVTPKPDIQPKITAIWAKQRPDKEDQEEVEQKMDQVQGDVGTDSLKNAIDLANDIVKNDKYNELSELEKLGFAILVARKKVKV